MSPHLNSGRSSTFMSLCFCLLSLFPLTVFGSPDTTLRQFYDAINDKQCQTAAALRDNYSETRCLEISEVIIHETDIAFNNGSDSVMLISIDIYTENAKSYFSGYVRLQKSLESDWKIIGPYKSKERYTLNEYVDDYLPNAEVATNTIAPNEELVSEQSIAIPVLEDEVIPEELAKYLSGKQAVAGNYTQLLNDLRQQLTALEPDQILLIDRSRSSLYLYNQRNLLLGFFPILSLDIEQVPNGLFTAEKAANNENTPVHLNQLHSLDEVLDKDSNSHYIRDLLDSDSARSLLLSPIDLGKLNTLLSGNTLIYLGD